MSAATQYLTAYKKEALAAHLRSAGYDVREDVPPYDLVAEKGAERIAYEVRVPPVSADGIEQLRADRARSLKEGYTEFRTVIASRPKPVIVDVDGLDQALFAALANDPPSELLDLGPCCRVEDVADVEIEEAEVTRDGVRVAGNGTVGVDLEYGGGVEKDGMTTYAVFPFSFVVRLDRDLAFVEWEEIVVDTIDYQETRLRA